MRRCIQPSGRSRQVIPTSRERSIDLIDLSPSYAEGSSSGLPWHCWLSGPRPPAATHPISSNRPGNTHCSRAPCSSIGCSSAHTQLRLAGCCHPPVRVVSFVFLFFFFLFFCLSSPCFTHTAERKGSQSEKKSSTLSQHRRAALANRRLFVLHWLWQEKKWHLDILFLNAIAKIHRDGLKRGKNMF